MPEIIYYKSPVGLLTAGISPKGLAYLRVANQAAAPTIRPHPIIDWLNAWFAGQKPDPAIIRLDLRGTNFQLTVWQRLMQIPFGHKTSYGALARELKTSPRALGQGIAKNPVWIIIPCHRVLYANGEPGGYAGGLAMKKFLLDFENIHL